MRTTLARSEPSRRESHSDVIRAFIVESLLLGQAQGLSDTESLYDSGVLDSTAVMELVAFIEERFKVEIHDSDMTEANLGSIANIDRFVASKLNGSRKAEAEPAGEANAISA